MYLIPDSTGVQHLFFYIGLDLILFCSADFFSDLDRSKDGDINAKTSVLVGC